MKFSRWPGWQDYTHQEALYRSLRNREDIIAEHSALIILAFSLARKLDNLEDGVDPETGKLEIIRLCKEYRDTLIALGIDNSKKTAASKPNDKTTETKTPAGKTVAASVTALDVFRQAHGA